MKNLPTLSHDRLLALVFYNRLTGRFTHSKPRRGVRTSQYLGHVEVNGYRRLMIDGHRYLAHRLAWFYVHGVWPDGNIDHKNMRRDDNWIENLRPASVSQNHANMKARQSRSGLKGAHWNSFRGHWQSYIKVNGRSIFLGRFNTAEAAHEAYRVASEKHFGEFARVA